MDFCQMCFDEYLRKEDGVIRIWIASLIGGLFAQLEGVKCKNTLPFCIHTTRGRGPLLDVEAKERNIYKEAGHYSTET